jgi:SOS-response transcriptional repressor LexA
MRILWLTNQKQMRMCIRAATKGLEMKSMSKKIRALRVSLGGIAQWELGKKIDVPQATVSKWEADKQQPDAANSKKLADLAGQTLEEWLGMPSLEISTGGRRLAVIGAVEAGTWIEETEWSEEDRYELGVPLPARWAGVPVHGLEVRGDSMNLLYPNESIVWVVPLSYSPGSPKDGDIVVAVHRGQDGTYERTLKEFRRGPDGQKWLWPKSTSPEHQAPVSFSGKKTDEVVVVGCVISAYVSAPNFTPRA